MSKSELEQAFLTLWDNICRDNGIDPVLPRREYYFAKPRRWRFDFAWPEQMVAVEIEGGLWIKGRHTTATGMIADMDKYNAATALGWSVLRFSDKHLRDGQAVFETIIDAMNAQQQRYKEA